MRASLIVVALALSALAFVGSDPAQVGPLTSISCDAGSVVIAPGDNAPAMVWGAAASASICFKAGGVHQPASPINVKSGQRLICEYGAVLDGSAVYQSYDPGSAAIIRGQGAITDVVVRNCVIRNAPLSSIFAYNGTNRWTIDHNEITGNTYGPNLGYNDGARITNNLIHHNNNPSRPDFTGGYGGNVLTNVLLEGNAFSYNGHTQKIVESSGVTFRGNTFDHEDTAIWIDGDNTNVLIENNAITDTLTEGIFCEISAGCTIRNNTVKRVGQHGIFVSTSRDSEVAGNTVEDAWRGIQLFLACDRLGLGAVVTDLRNVNVHDNTVKVGTQSGSYAAGMSQAACSADQLAAYTNGSKGLTFTNNHYSASDLTGAFWLWGDSIFRWGEWQALPQDATGTFSLIGSVPAPTPDPVPPPPTPTPSDLAAPVVTFPVPSGIRRKSKVKLTASATDDVAVTSLQILVNGAVCGSGVPSASCTWGVPAAPGRSYNLQAVATDAVGHKAIVLVTVNPQ